MIKLFFNIICRNYITPNKIIEINTVISTKTEWLKFQYLLNNVYCVSISDSLFRIPIDITEK